MRFTTSSLDGTIIALLIVIVLVLAFSVDMLGRDIHLFRDGASTVEWQGKQEMRGPWSVTLRSCVNARV
jgi:hypothetical protein